MHRFFINPEDIHSEEVNFSNASAKQIARVLRLKSGDQCMALDNLGNEMLVELVRVNPDGCTASILKKTEAEEPHTRLSMLLCLTQRDKFEWMLQKCTEVGAAAFQPVISRRSLVQEKTDMEAKYVRWRMILKEAAEQSGRGRIPELLPTVSLTKAVLAAARDNPLCLIPWEEERNTGLKKVLTGRKVTRIAALIGPEGGFSAEEVQSAVDAGFQRVTLGKRILRMETAAVVTAALVFHELE